MSGRRPHDRTRYGCQQDHSASAHAGVTSLACALALAGYAAMRSAASRRAAAWAPRGAMPAP